MTVLRLSGFAGENRRTRLACRTRWACRALRLAGTLASGAK